MLFLVARLANRDEPFDRLPADVTTSIAFVMDLGCSPSAINAAMIVSLQNQPTFSLPVVGV